MKFEFSNKRLQRLYEKEGYAIKELGVSCARKLKARLSDVRAANTVNELVAGNPHPLLGKREGQFSIAIGEGNCIVFVPTNRPTPLIGKNKIDWSQVTEIEIIEIGDYHD